MPHSFHADCGFQVFTWLYAYLTGHAPEAISPAKAEGWRRIFMSRLLRDQLAEKNVIELPMGGLKTDQLTDQADQLLMQHGV